MDVSPVSEERGIWKEVSQFIPEASLMPPDYNCGLEEEVELWSCCQVKYGGFFKQNNDWFPLFLHVLQSILDLGPFLLNVRS